MNRAWTNGTQRLFVVGLFIQLLAHGQTPAKPASLADRVIPPVPVELLRRAEQLNGLANAGPWHLIANFQLFDPKGKNAGDGTIEVWWASPTRHKIVYSAPGFSQTEISTEKGTTRIGDQDSPPARVFEALFLLTAPLNSVSLDAANRSILQQRIVARGGGKLRCLRFVQRPVPTGLRNDMSDDEIRVIGATVQVNDADRRCFDEDSEVLRQSTDGVFRNEAFFQDIVKLRGHFVARQITVLDGEDERKSLTVQVAKLEDFKPDAIVFDTPATASETPPTPFKVPASMLGRFGDGERLYNANDYPATYTFRIVADATGLVTSADILKGPARQGERIAKRLAGQRIPHFEFAGTPVSVTAVFTYSREEGLKNAF